MKKKCSGYGRISFSSIEWLNSMKYIPELKILNTDTFAPIQNGWNSSEHYFIQKEGENYHRINVDGYAEANGKKYIFSFNGCQ